MLQLKKIKMFTDGCWHTRCLCKNHDETANAKHMPHYTRMTA